MARLNSRAYKLLDQALKDYCRQHNFVDVQRQIVARRLARLQMSPGDRATYDDLRAAFGDCCPGLDDRTLRQVAKLNQPSPIEPVLSILGFGTVGLVVAAAGLWVVNLPFPPIRLPVAKVAPILLLPSFWQMDRSYRGAISSVEQARQLIDSATAAPDFALGATKINEAKGYLDGLPVWFLGYSPQAYCTFFGCTWRFTLDEFEAARANVGRMEARLFQENNAQTALKRAIEASTAAKAQYASAQTPEAKNAAIAAWQGAIDQLKEIPGATLAGKQARVKQAALERDFQQAAGFTIGNQRAGNFIMTAKAYAQAAALATQKPPHRAEVWDGSLKLWEKAIDELNKINDPNDPDYATSRQLLVQYETNAGVIRQRKQAEEKSRGALDRAKSNIARWQTLATSKPNSPNLVGDLKMIANDLDQVQPGTTATAEAQQLRTFAEQQLKKIAPVP